MAAGLAFGAALVAVSMAGLALAQTAPAVEGAGTSPGYTPPPEVVPVVVAVVGDSYTGGSAMGGSGGANWTQLLKADLNRNVADTTVVVTAGGGSGYLATGLTNRTFDQMVRQGVNADDDVVIIFGSRNDSADSATLGAAATTAIANARQLAPSAQLVIIGPPWTSENVPNTIVVNRDAIAQAAAAASATFIDPLEQGWFFGADSRLIGTDGVHPTDEGHLYMEQKLLPQLQPLVEQIAAAKGASRTTG